MFTALFLIRFRAQPLLVCFPGIRFGGRYRGLGFIAQEAQFALKLLLLLLAQLHGFEVMGIDVSTHRPESDRRCHQYGAQYDPQHMHRAKAAFAPVFFFCRSIHCHSPDVQCTVKS